MTTRFYKVPGSSEYVTWDYLHNTLGYSTSATETVGYKSTIDWGADAGIGYCTDTTDYEAEWFVQGETGWAGLNGLAWGCNVYPGSATDIKVERSGTESNAASMTFDGVEYWLVESEIGDAWWLRSRWEQQGWSIVEDHVYEFVFVDATTGRVTSGVERIDEIVFAEAGYFTIDDTDDVIFVEESPFPVVCTHSGTQTATSIAPNASFDTGLQYYSSKLYIGETDDGQGNVTRYGWEAEEGTVVVYEEVTLYYEADSSARNCQGSVTSNYTGEPQEAYLKQLYTQSGTTSALYLAVYDPEKRYEHGHYNSTTGEWEPYSMQSLSDMPATTDSPYEAEIIVCNKFSLVNNWYITNYPGSASTIRSTATYSIFRLYKLTPGIDYVYVDAILYCKASKSVANFNDDDYWYSYMGEDTAETLQSFGVTIRSDNNGKSIAAGNIGIGSGKFSFKIIALYSDDGVTEIETDLSNFYMNPRSSYSYDTNLYIMSKAAFNGVCAYKCRVIKKLTAH